MSEHDSAADPHTDASEVTIRRAASEDGPRLRELNEVALRQVDAFVEDVCDKEFEDVPDDLDADLANVEAAYLEDDGEFLVAVSEDGTADGDDRVVGMGGLQPVGDHTFQADAIVGPEHEPAGEITRMRVDPAFQGRGIGTRLLERLEAQGRELGYETLVLDTTARQDAAQGLYEGFGYEHEDTVEWREYEIMLYRKALDGDDSAAER